MEARRPLLADVSSRRLFLFIWVGWGGCCYLRKSCMQKLRFPCLSGWGSGYRSHSKCSKCSGAVPSRPCLLRLQARQAPACQRAGRPAARCAISSARSPPPSASDAVLGAATASRRPTSSGEENRGGSSGAGSGFAVAAAPSRRPPPLASCQWSIQHLGAQSVKSCQWSIHRTLQRNGSLLTWVRVIAGLAGEEMARWSAGRR